MADKIIILSGKQFSGKDTVAKILLEQLPSFRRIALGDAIKLEYSKITGLTIDEIEKNKSQYRPDLIALGDKGRATHPDYWLNNVIEQEGDIIVPDVRVPRELELFRTKNAFSIRVEASQEARAKRGLLVKEDDMTETVLDSVEDWNYIIQNDYGYEELEEKCVPLIEAINKHFDHK